MNVEQYQILSPPYWITDNAYNHKIDKHKWKKWKEMSQIKILVSKVSIMKLITILVMTLYVHEQTIVP